MAMYVNGSTIAYGALPVGAIEQVGSLPAVGGADHLYLLTAQYSTYEPGLYYFDGSVWHSTGSGGADGTSDYNELTNKPRINGVELINNKSLTALDIAAASQTYTKVQVDELISAAQKVYLSTTIPTSANNVGLYYVDATGTGTNYNIYLVDSTKSVASLGSAGISLIGYQKEIDAALSWTATSTVVGSINDLKYRLDNLPTGGTITMNGTITGSPTFYAPTTSGAPMQVLKSMGPNQAPQWVTETATGGEGTKVHLNGNTAIAAEANVYTPTSAGTAGQILVSEGPGAAPMWRNKDAAEAPQMTINGVTKAVTPATAQVYTPLTAGTAGQVLKSTGGIPEWADSTGGGGSGEMTLNDELVEVTAETKVYSPKDSGSKAKMLVGNETTNTPTWEVSCRSVTLTKAEYDALTTDKKNNPNIIYYITDDVAGTTDDPAIRWSETLKSSYTSATDKQVYTAKAVNDFISDIKSEVFNMIYPIGSYAFGSKPTMGTWTQVTGDRALWLKNTVADGTTISQGLPNIQGSITASAYSFANDKTANITKSGALSVSGSKKASSGESNEAIYPNNISFNASSSNSIYGASTNVQPNAYVMSVFKRIA